ncbi:MAG TPA: hypothetical protein VFR86_08725 [Burkholderiaceae bacterium]|nr:hypothetical protein [Burkholderiaceae bacterium]
MKRLLTMLWSFFGLCLLAGGVAAQSKPYAEGTVWAVSFIQVKAGMLDVYLRELAPQRKAIIDEAKKQGLILSSRILTGPNINKEDWNLMILDEYKNWAAFDGLSAKMDALAAKVVGPEDKQVQLMIKRTEVREIIGGKTMQELMLK